MKREGKQMILALYGAGAMGREFKYIADESGKIAG